VGRELRTLPNILLRPIPSQKSDLVHSNLRSHATTCRNEVGLWTCYSRGAGAGLNGRSAPMLPA
jgi:hypothetical protein